MKMLRLRTGPASDSKAAGRSAAGSDRQKLYQTSRWRKLRRAHLAQEPLCVHCKREGRTTPAVAVDHILGHNSPDWRDRFFDPANLMSLCTPCHAIKTKRESGGRGYQNSGRAPAPIHGTPLHDKKSAGLRR